MKTRPLYRTGICIAFALTAVVAGSQEPDVLTIEAVVHRAVAVDRTLMSLERRAAEQADALGIGRYRDALRLTLTGSLSGRLPDAPSYGGSGTLSAEVAILPQLSVTGAIVSRLPADGLQGRPSDPVTGEVGVRFTPLADAGGRSRDELALAETERRLIETARRTAYTAASRLLSAVAAHAEVPLARERAAIADARLEQTRLLSARELATSVEVANAENAVRSAANAVARAQLDAARALDSLAQLLQIAIAPAELPSWERLDLERRVADAARERAGASAEALAAEAPGAVAAEFALASARLTEMHTRVFTPQLTLSGSFGIPASTYSAEARFSVSAADFDRGRKEAAVEATETASIALDNAQRTARFAIDQALLDYDIATRAVDAAVRSQALAEQELARVRFRNERGEATRLALRDAERVVSEAIVAVESSRAAALRAWLAVTLVQLQ
ncbi:MAG: TolC family protein [Spirochaetaceae bacterium]|nr:MAG: TolC family protein [Spirochaetaceae bacterium]